MAAAMGRIRDYDKPFPKNDWEVVCGQVIIRGNEVTLKGSTWTLPRHRKLYVYGDEPEIFLDDKLWTPPSPAKETIEQKQQ
jgi:hypothetical protein